MSSTKIQTYSQLPNVGIKEHNEKSSQRIPSHYLIALLAFYLLIAFLTKTVEDDLPAVILEKDILKNDSKTFSEENARKFLDIILGDGPRVAGTTYHYRKTKDLKELVDNIARNAKLPVHTDWQMVSGDYLRESTTPNVNVYQNVSSIVAVLEGESGFNPDGTTNTSLLVNCHYDSVPFATGASDNGVFCATMAEVLIKLCRRQTKFKHNVVFLFNGAEESALLGSHGFLKHAWFRGVTNIINLDSAGMNGNPSVFQVTDPRVLEIYKETTLKPNAQGVGEVLFESGIIPSDTDFRIFRDFGHVHGLDIAFVKDGQVYHTRNDVTRYIQDGVIQNAGNMLLSIIIKIADYIELKTKENKLTVVYYDYLQLFLITYSYKTALIIDSVVAILGFASVFYYLWLFGLRKAFIRELLWTVAGRICNLLAGVIAVYVCTYIMLLTTTQMKYLSHPLLVTPFYWIPFFVGSFFASYNFDSLRSRKVTLSHSIRCLQTMTATRLLLSILLLLLCFIPSLTNIRYVITVFVTILTFSSFVNMTLVRYRRLKAWQHLTLETILTLPATAFGFSLALRFILLLIPIMGRSGNDYPDFVLATICSLMAAIVSLSVSGVELLFSRKRFLHVLSNVLIVCVFIMCVPFNPYGGETVTQRHYWFHSQLTTYNKNFTPIEQSSGVLLTKVDAYNTECALEAIKSSQLYVSDSDKLSGAGDSSLASVRISDSDVSVITDCETSLYCGMPIYRVSFNKFLKGSLFVKMSPPAEFNRSVRLINRHCIKDNCVLNFRMKGPAHNTLTIWPRSNINIESWTFESPLTITLEFKGRPVYVVVQCKGTYSDTFQPLDFNLTLNVPNEVQSQTLVDISHDASQIYHPDRFTNDYKELVNAMPEYFNIATFLTFRDNYEF